MAEINELTVCKSWIAYELQQDSVIQEKIGDSFFAGIADNDSGNFYIVFRYVTGTPTRKLGMRRKLIRLLFDIKVYQRGGGDADFTAVVNRVEEMFGNFSNRRWAGWNFSSEMETPLDLPENDREKDEQWQGTGATYRISAYKL